MSLLEGLAQWPGALLLQRSGTAYLVVNAAHILGIGLLLGSIVPLDLRLGRGRADALLGSVAPVLLRTATLGLGLALLTGLWLFTVNPVAYAGNPALWVKAALLALALVNVAFQHRDVRLARALAGEGTPVSVRGRALLSIVLWLGVLLAGRWIGFV